MSEIIEILELSDLDEYFIKVRVNGLILDAMISSAPYVIEVGKKYRGNFSYTNFNNYETEQSESSCKQLLHMKNYSYKANGLLVSDGHTDVGIHITSEVLEDTPDLIGQYVAFVIDRLELSFD
ncbi:TPA: hypothetical protein U2C96_001323 [Streptococcus suis]|nr:hypothetical protein [Streptococcus suis]HEL9643409.1 hypothetical protein [Streptococcus suis]HEM5106899.1 hypothetical protein [Streptococcus suis]HEM5201172.1 hypothetical protein [Streptococcus suis]HEM5931964.1 hypothetical protein [Streptococcus suis]